MSEGQLKGITRSAEDQTKPESQVRVLYGVHAIEANLAGRAVGDVRQALRQALNISPQAVAVVDGREVEESFLLLAGQQLEFVRLAGEKGAWPTAHLSARPSGMLRSPRTAETGAASPPAWTCGPARRSL